LGKELLENLSPLLAELEPSLKKRVLPLFHALAKERSEDFLLSGLFQIGIQLKSEHQEIPACLLFERLSRADIPQKIREQAQKERDAVMGTGSSTMRLAYLLSGLSGARYLREVVPMLGAGLIGKVAGTLAFARTGSRLLTGIAAWMAEVPAYLGLSQTLTPEHGVLGSGWIPVGLGLGAMKLSQGLAAKLPGGFLRTQGSIFLGLWGTRRLEEHFQLRPTVEDPTRAVDVLYSMATLLPGAALANRAWGRPLAEWRHRAQTRADAFLRTPAPAFLAEVNQKTFAPRSDSAKAPPGPNVFAITSEDSGSGSGSGIGSSGFPPGNGAPLPQRTIDVSPNIHAILRRLGQSPLELHIRRGQPDGLTRLPHHPVPLRVYEDTLRDGDTEVRVGAIRMLIDRRDPASLPALRRLLSNSEDPRVRLEAVRALGELGTPEDHGLLWRRVLGDWEQRVQYYAGAALYKLGHPDVESILQRMMGDEDPQQAITAAEIIGGWGGHPEAHLSLERWLTHPELSVSHHASVTLEKLGRPGRSVLGASTVAPANLFMIDDPSPLRDSRVERGLYVRLDGDAWKDAFPKLQLRKGELLLTLLGHEVMSSYQVPYMERLADIVTRKPGRILNVGYGMGILAGAIERHRKERGVTDHFIIELNRHLADSARRANPRHIVLEGDWRERISDFPFQSLDGIVYDGYPLSPNEVHRDGIPFIQAVVEKGILKKGGVLTFFADAPEGFGEGFRAYLSRLGFSSVKWERVEVKPPPRFRQHWQHNHFIAPTLIY
jgi:guanidinoacetate N-methyltransferase